MRRKRDGYIRQTSMPAQRLGQRTNNKIYLFRRVVFIAAIVLTLSFIGKIVLSFFGAEYVSLELSGNMHYTDVQIYDALGEQLQNIVTDSEEQTSIYLKKHLSYIKDAHVTKHVIKRMLTIEITEREPFVRLRVDPTANAAVNRDSSFFLVDSEGHVLKHIDKEDTNPQISEQFGKMVVLRTVNDELPKVGATVEMPGVALGLEILKTALLQERNLATQIESIDASDPQKIKLQLDAFPVSVWFAADAIELGLHHIALFVKQHKIQVLQLIRENSVETQPYLDARFQDTIYLGGFAESK
ncbi:MAG: FtsQ-type POTRA domain-containing protein [Candidatus Poribacteria bacterium]|nr:FtsQ-type POTRA domain-containing protein [Candidatus Poribacteria bacterium]